MTIHLNVVSKYLATHPNWADDCIPLCAGPGDTDADLYTLDAKAVTCEACSYELLAPLIDAGKLCPHCKRHERISRETNLGMPCFYCAMCRGPRWFDSITMETEDAA